MADLRSFYTATLAQIEKDKATLQQQLEALHNQERTIRGWIAANGNGHSGAVDAGDSTNPLTAFVLRALTQNDMVTTEMLKKEADREGVEYKDGRSFNAVLMNLYQNERVQRVGEGTWALQKK